MRPAACVVLADDGVGVDPKDFARTLFPKLLDDRKPRYEEFAKRYGITVNVGDLFPNGKMHDGDGLIDVLHNLLTTQAADNPVAAANADRYLKACVARARARGLTI